MFEALARLADRHARRVALAGAVFFVVAATFGGSVASKLDPYGADDPASESVRADEALKGAGHRRTAVVVLVQGGLVTANAARVKVERIERQLRANPDVASVTGYYDSGSRDFVSRDGRATYLAVALRPTGDRQWQEAARGIKDDLAGRPGVMVGGPAIAQEEVNGQVEADLTRAEMIAFPLLFLLSLLFFRSLVAALLPLVVGGLSIVGTFLVLRLASEVGSISLFALNLTTALGLGLAIDYSLFIVSRYREEIAKDGPGLSAMRRTIATAGRTVLFSSLTVAVALASLTVMPQRILYSMGLGGAAVALLAALIALTVLPAVLTLLGHRVNALSPHFLRRRAEADARPTEAGFWYRLSRFVMRRPLPIAIASASVLIIAGIPFYSIKFTSVDAQILPESASSNRVDDVMRAEFPPYRDQPITVMLEGAGPKRAARVRARVKRIPGVEAVNPPQRVSADITIVDAISRWPYVDDRSRSTVRAVRDLPAPSGTRLLVTGTTARFLDFQSSLENHMPLVLGIVIGATLVILFVMTGSVILPFKSLVMNLLNLSAVFGILVLIFQDGRFEGLLAYTSQGAIEQTIPILLFAVAFGLSTDYAVFLLSRIKEAHDAGASNSESVSIGLERTGRIVTAAALLFAVAIGAFATSQIIFIKQNAIGTALAVLIDASIIRALLVPSLMQLLGKWNWWAPSLLRALHARLDLGEAKPTR